MVRIQVSVSVLSILRQLIFRGACTLYLILNVSKAMSLPRIKQDTFSPNLLIELAHFQVDEGWCGEFGEDFEVLVRFPGGLIAKRHLLTNGDGQSIPTRRLVHAQQVQEERFRLAMHSGPKKKKKV